MTDFLDEIVGDSEYKHDIPLKKEFQAWHRPRKQFVRKNQWASEIKKLIEDNPNINQPINYIGLPGKELIDIRYFSEEILSKNNIKLRFLGFNKEAQVDGPERIELNTSLHEVKSNQFIDESSNVSWDDFNSLSSTSSIAYQEARKKGPFTIVNLDLCDGVGKNRPNQGGNNYYNAIYNLLGIQSKSLSPWLLFLTTRTDRDNIHQEVIEALTDQYLSTLNECEEFKSSSQINFMISCKDELDNAVADPSGLFNIFTTSLCNWFFSNLKEHRPPTNVKLESIFSYNVSNKNEEDDIISICIKCKPTFDIGSDPYLLAKGKDDIAEQSKCSLATKTISRVKSRKNIDKVLSGAPHIYDAMVDESAKLLSLARFDETLYRKWVKDYKS